MINLWREGFDTLVDWYTCKQRLKEVVDKAIPRSMVLALYAFESDQFFYNDSRDRYRSRESLTYRK